MLPDHVLQAVDDQVALNAIDEARKFPAQTRFMIDAVKAGACGTPRGEFRDAWARTARYLSERLNADDRASAAPMADLADILESTSNDEEGQELCARGLAAAWRAEYPFRRGREGDPRDVVTPQLTDAESIVALDKARMLPRPPVGLVRRAAEVEEVLAGAPIADDQPYSQSLARVLLMTADEEMASLSSPSYVYSNYKNDVEVARIVLSKARLWVASAPRFDYEAHDAMFRLVDAARFMKNAANCADVAEMQARTTGSISSREREHSKRIALTCREAERVATRVTNVLKYVLHYSTQAMSLGEAESNFERAQEDLRRAPGRHNYVGSCERALADVQKYRAIFPDFYPEYA